MYVPAPEGPSAYWRPAASSATATAGLGQNMPPSTKSAKDLGKIAFIVGAAIALYLWSRPKKRTNPRLRSAARRRMPSTKFAMSGLRKLPIHDASHIRNAMSRFGQVKGASRAQRARAYQKILSAARRHGIGSEGFQARWAGRYGRVPRYA